MQLHKTHWVGYCRYTFSCCNFHHDILVQVCITSVWTRVIAIFGSQCVTHDSKLTFISVAMSSETSALALVLQFHRWIYTPGHETADDMPSTTKSSPCFYCAMLRERGIAMASRPSVRLSVSPFVTSRYRGHICWNTSKIISRLISHGFFSTQTQTLWIYSKRTTPKMYESMFLENFLRVIMLSYFPIRDRREYKSDQWGQGSDAINKYL